MYNCATPTTTTTTTTTTCTISVNVNGDIAWRIGKTDDDYGTKVAFVRRAHYSLRTPCKVGPDRWFLRWEHKLRLLLIAGDILLNFCMSIPRLAYPLPLLPVPF